MKYVAWGILILLCFVLGRVMYLPLAPALTGEGRGSGKKAESRQVVVFGPGTRQVEVTLDLKTVRDDEVPASVTLSKRVRVSAEDGSSATEISANDTVRVVERMGDNLKISVPGPLTGLVPIKNTDFAKRVIETRLGPLMEGGAIAQNPTPAPAPGTGTPPPVASNPGSGTGTPPAPKPVDPPPAPPKPADPKPSTPPPGTPVAVTDPEKMEPEQMEPEPAESEGGGKLTEEQIIELMKKSIAAGDIKEFTVDQVQAWKAGPEEEVDDVLYQTGLAAYKAATIFGDKIVQAKALIKDGKVQKWIYSKTGMEIR